MAWMDRKLELMLDMYPVGLMTGVVVDSGDGDAYHTCVRSVFDASFDMEVGRCRVGCDTDHSKTHYVARIVLCLLIIHK
jgi:hypothetical protein